MYFCVVLCIVCFVSFPVLFVCICVLYYCHRAATQLQIKYIISYQNTNISHPPHPVLHIRLDLTTAAIFGDKRLLCGPLNFVYLPVRVTSPTLCTIFAFQLHLSLCLTRLPSQHPTQNIISLFNKIPVSTPHTEHYPFV
jgi:hypothetical protein